MYHIEKGDYVNKYQRYENNPISAFIYKSLGILCISLVVSYGNLITTAAYSVYINDGSIIDVPIISEEIFNNKEETK